MELVILAAGMGSRFGGLKQLEPMDNSGNFIIDYSVYDAVVSGFDRVTFIIRKENEQVFRDTIGKRVESHVKHVEYVFQENYSIRDSRVPKGRTKPLGTAHAVLCCRGVVKQPFMIINSDDFYGREPYKLARDFINDGCTPDTYGCVAYSAGNTLTDHGSVKRGVCTIESGNVVGITECKICRNIVGNIDASPLGGGDQFTINNNTPVSMNMFILHPNVFDELEKGFDKFLSGMEDPMNDEYLLPDVISKMVSSGRLDLKMIKSPENWYGVTYREDKGDVVASLARMVGEGKYPRGLWN